MSIRPRKKNETLISLNKAYQVVLSPLITEKATQMSEFNKIVFSVPLSASKFDIKLSIEKIFSVIGFTSSNCFCPRFIVFTPLSLCRCRRLRLRRICREPVKFNVAFILQ